VNASSGALRGRVSASAAASEDTKSIAMLMERKARLKGNSFSSVAQRAWLWTERQVANLPTAHTPVVSFLDTLRLHCE
jgi:hypothetical protein